MNITKDCYVDVEGWTKEEVEKAAEIFKESVLGSEIDDIDHTMDGYDYLMFINGDNAPEVFVGNDNDRMFHGSHIKLTKEQVFAQENGMGNYIIINENNIRDELQIGDEVKVIKSDTKEVYVEGTVTYQYWENGNNDLGFNVGDDFSIVSNTKFRVGELIVFKKVKEEKELNWYEKGELPPVGETVMIYDDTKAYIVGYNNEGGIVFQILDGRTCNYDSFIPAHYAKNVFAPIDQEKEDTIRQIADEILEFVNDMGEDFAHNERDIATALYGAGLRFEDKK